MGHLNAIEEIDRQILVNVLGRSGVADMYTAARNQINKPLTLHAAQLLIENIKENGTVFIATGALCRWSVDPSIGETDGPPGAAWLARFLHIAFRVTPILLVEDELIEPMRKVMISAGLFPFSSNKALKVLEITKAQADKPLKQVHIMHGCSVLGFPKETEQARKASEELISTFSPSAIITVEKLGANEKGVIHTSRGLDASAYMSKIDPLIDEAKKRGILTIGIGDGGNEVGMGVIGEYIKAKVPYGLKCRCPCGSGIVPYNKTDCLIVAPISNIGAYGLEAAMARLLKRPDIMHDGEMELRLLSSASDAGFLDSRTGYSEPSADGLSARYHSYIVELLRKIVRDHPNGYP